MAPRTQWSRISQPLGAHKLSEAFGPLLDKSAGVMADGQFCRLAAVLGRTAVLGAHHQAAHVRQAAGGRLDCEDFDVAAFYPAVPAILGVAGKRGWPAAATRSG